MSNTNIAMKLADMITAKQLAMIRALARYGQIDADKECIALMHCSIDELSKRAASDFIDHLQRMQEGRRK
jgi:hypothetical protein